MSKSSPTERRREWRRQAREAREADRLVYPEKYRAVEEAEPVPKVDLNAPAWYCPTCGEPHEIGKCPWSD